MSFPFVELIKFSAGSILWGAAFTIIITIVIFLVCRSINTNIWKSTGSTLVLALLFFLLGAQGTMMVGAAYLKGYVDDVKSTFDTFLPEQNAEMTTAIPMDEIQQIRRQIADNYPILTPYLDKIDPQQASSLIENKGTSFSDSLADSLKDTLDDYILRRVFWMVGMIVCALILIFLLRKKDDGGSSSLSGDYSYGDDSSYNYGNTDDY